MFGFRFFLTSYFGRHPGAPPAAYVSHNGTWVLEWREWTLEIEPPTWAQRSIPSRTPRAEHKEATE